MKPALSAGLLQRWHPRQSLRRMFFWVLLPALIVIILLGQWFTYRTLDQATDTAYDRVLLGSLRALESGVIMLDGEINVLVPYDAIGMYETVSESKFYYRVTDEAGKLLTGYADLPNPPTPLQLGKTVVYEGPYQGEEIRVAALWKQLSQDGVTKGAKLYIAERVQHRDALLATVWRTALGRDFLLLLAVVSTVIMAIYLGLRPLSKLRADISQRAPDDLTPIAVDSVPREVRPLVDAINHHIGRSAQLSHIHAQFLADASHQLRTPLAILLTQAEYALRSNDLAQVHETLNAIVLQLEQTSRVTQQLLALARAQQSDPRALQNHEAVDVRALVASVAHEHLAEARQKYQDFGLDETCDEAEPLASVVADPMWLREALSNLVHNAIAYTPERGKITLSAQQRGREVWLSVEDNGPGIPAAERERVFERFVRLSPSAAEGSGLGLAITRELVQHCGGRIVLATAAPQGLIISIVLPVKSA